MKNNYTANWHIVPVCKCSVQTQGQFPRDKNVGVYDFCNHRIVTSLIEIELLLEGLLYMSYHFTARCCGFVLRGNQNKVAACTTSAASGAASAQPPLSKQGYDNNVMEVCHFTNMPIPFPNNATCESSCKKNYFIIYP